MKLFTLMHRLRKVLGKFGLWNMFSYLQGYITKKTVNLNLYGQKVFLRGRTSDMATFNQIFLEEEYGYVYSGDIKYIIDAGANIGLTTIRFKYYYPEATIIAIEPNNQNYELLSHNTKQLSNIKLIHGAITDQDSIMTLTNPSANNSGFRYTKESDNTETVQGFAINTIIQEKNIPQIDILKCDIEGGEKILFSQNTGRIDKTNNIAIELHDRFLPGTAKSFFDAISKYNYNLSQKGETLLIHSIK